jgi:hypothetical protein
VVVPLFVLGIIILVRSVANCNISLSPDNMATSKRSCSPVRANVPSTSSASKPWISHIDMFIVFNTSFTSTICGLSSSGILFLVPL